MCLFVQNITKVQNLILIQKFKNNDLDVDQFSWKLLVTCSDTRVEF